MESLENYYTLKLILIFNNQIIFAVTRDGLMAVEVSLKYLHILLMYDGKRRKQKSQSSDYHDRHRTGQKASNEASKDDPEY